MQKIEIRECEYEGSWIEVGLKAEAASRSSNRNQSTTLNESYRSAADVAQATADPTMTSARYTELLDKFADQKKQKRTAETEKQREISQLQQRNNQLQTDFENAKVMTAGAQKKAKQAQDLVAQVEEQIQEQKSALELKTQQYEQTVSQIGEKDEEIAALNSEIITKDQELDDLKNLGQSAIKDTQQAEQDLDNWFDMKRYDTNFMSDILTLLKPKQKQGVDPHKAMTTRASTTAQGKVQTQ